MQTLELLLHYLTLLFMGGLLFAILSSLVVGLFALIVQPSIFGQIVRDLKAIRERDPAAEGWLAAMCYPGWWALTLHRLIAHPLYKMGLRTPARLYNFFTRFLTGADLHPGASFGSGIFIDHAHGVVIGETAEVGNNVTILHQVTLGGTGKETGKRHPTVRDGVLLAAGAKVLGNIVVGEAAKIGSGSVVVKPVPAYSTVVGVPGRIVIMDGKRLPSQSLDQTALPDPVVEKIRELEEELHTYEKAMQERQARITDFVERAPGRNVLTEIVEYKRLEVEAAQQAVSLETLRASTGKRGSPRSFKKALSSLGLSLIAEVKKASPSGGLLRADFEPVRIAQTYQASMASALSILTDRKYFQGDLKYLAEVRQTVGLPILRKDFTIHEYQIVEAARAGADAVLLIAACLDDAQLKGFRETAAAEGLDALVEVHDLPELDRALKSGAEIVGINNRNLKTLVTDLETTFKLLERLSPTERAGKIIVSESGIRSNADIHRLNDAGVNAVLIGETFMRASDIGAKVREVMGYGDYTI